MKRNSFIIKKISLILGVLSCFGLLIALFIFTFTSCDKKKRIKYYSNDDNYIVLNGEIKEIVYWDSDFQRFLDLQGFLILYIDVFETDLDWYVSTNGGAFEICEESQIEMRKNGFFEEVQVGDEIEFRAILKKFKKNDFFPIAEINVNQKNYLDFHTGKEFILNYYA